MWLIGGSDIKDNNFIDFNDVWNSTNGRDWHLVTSDAAWSPRGGFDPFVFDDKIWVIGGFTKGSGNNDVWTSVDGKNWEFLKFRVIEGGFGGYKAVVFENKIWIFDSGAFNSDYYVWYSADGINYTKSHLNNFSNFTALEFKNKIWLLGGWTNFLSTHIIFNTELINFDPAAISDTQTFTPNWHPRHDHASVVFKNKIWVLGGVHFRAEILGNNFSVDLQTSFNDIWSWDNSQSDWTKER